MGFLGGFVGVIRVLQCSFRMPAPHYVIAFLIMFGSRTVGLRRQLVLLGRPPVFLMHDQSSCGMLPNNRQAPPIDPAGWLLIYLSTFVVSPSEVYGRERQSDVKKNSGQELCCEIAAVKRNLGCPT